MGQRGMGEALVKQVSWRFVERGDAYLPKERT